MLQAPIEMLQKPNVTSTRSFGRNALVCATAWNDITGVQMLLPFGIDVLHYNVKQPKLVLAMVVSEQLRCGEAGRAYNSEILEAILEIVTDLNCAFEMDSKLHYNPLLAAIDAGDVEFANMLINQANPADTNPTSMCFSKHSHVQLSPQQDADIHAPAFNIKEPQPSNSLPCLRTSVSYIACYHLVRM